MVVGIIGENCSGKSTLAEVIRADLGAEIVTGKDWLRMAKSESRAAALFVEKLKGALTGENVIYVISEPEQLKLLPEGAVRILVKAELAVIKERFRARMRGNLPDPVEQMLERKHGLFDGGEYDYVFRSGEDDPVPLCEALKARL